MSTPAAQNVVALQQRMVQLGFGVSAAGVYGASEDTVVRSYGAQLGETDFSNLNAVIAEILPVMDADIEVKGAWQPPPPGPLTAGDTQISGAAGPPWGLLVLVGFGLWWLGRR
jgi:hypothetical protein